MGEKLSVVSCEKEQVRHGKQAQNWLVLIISFDSGGGGAASTCLVPGCEVIRAGREWPRMWQPEKRGGWGMALDWLVFIRRPGLQVNLYYLQELASLGRGTPSRASKSPGAKASEIRKIKRLINTNPANRDRVMVLFHSAQAWLTLLQHPCQPFMTRAENVSV